MSRNDLSLKDASERAGSQLDVVLRSKQATQANDRVSVDEALKQGRLSTSLKERSAARVLFISQDTTLLNPSTQSLDGFLNLKDLFEEVHILILRDGIPAKNPVLRVEDNVWLYTATSKSWLTLTRAGVKLAEQELVFAGGFRPDLIVARDPFESALVGRDLAKSFGRPLQIHVLQNYTTDEFRQKASKNFWRRFIPKRTLPAATSVRADTAAIMDVLTKHFEIPDVALLPKYHAYESYIDLKTDLDLKQKYPQFVFFFVYAGTLSHESTLYRAIDALRYILQNPRVGLIVLGDGPAQKEFQKRTQLLGIDRQVIFEKRPVDLVAYLKAAQVLVITDTDAAGDDIALKGAGAGIPTVMAATESRADYFEANISAYLCPPDDTAAFAAAAGELLNNPGKRAVMREYAQDMIRHRFHRNKDHYRQAFRQSIEQTLFVTDEAGST